MAKAAAAFLVISMVFFAGPASAGDECEDAADCEALQDEDEAETDDVRDADDECDDESDCADSGDERTRKGAIGISCCHMTAKN
jgi:hypothetical protein